MDSLLANYASSDEEERGEQPPPVLRSESVKSVTKSADEKNKVVLSKRIGISDSLPKPKSSLFNSLPAPTSQSLPKSKPQAESENRREIGDRDGEVVGNWKSKPSSLFSSVPAPKSSSSASKTVVQFRPPTVINQYASDGYDKEDDDSDEDEKERQRKRSKDALSTASTSSFLSSMPAPKQSATLGAMPSSSGTGRRSILETDNQAPSASTGTAAGNDHSSEMNYDYSSWTSGNENHAYFSGEGSTTDGNSSLAPVSGVSSEFDAAGNLNVGYSGDHSHEIYDHSGIDANAGSYDYTNENGHVDYTDYAGYGNNAQYGSSWTNATALPEVSGVMGNELQLRGKRGRKDVPPEIIEVKQDELMKNRPREDQVKSTGIAFGPAYQPASTKGKPNKLHKRKHQIGSLYFEMRQKETELAERRSKGFLTKAQTQAKYGW